MTTPTPASSRVPQNAVPPDADTDAGGPIRIRLRLPRRDPFDFAALVGFLGPRAVRGVEEAFPGGYRRSMRLPHGAALVELRDDVGAVRCDLALADPSDLPPAVARVRRLLDLDADPLAIADVLGSDPLLGPLVATDAGRRAPGAVDGLELVVRAIAGQQVSVASATAIVGRIAARLGTPLPTPVGSVTHLFPDAERLAEASDEDLPLPLSRRTTVRAVAAAMASGQLVIGAGADREEAAARLREIPGIGPWTEGYIALRALGDPDVLLVGDLGVRKAARALGLPVDPSALADRGARWAPWRSYATHHLWASLGHAEVRR